MNSKTIIWDIDDVLNNLMEEWLQTEWMKNNPKSDIKYTDIKSNPPHSILGITKDDYLVSLDKFRLESFHKLKPNPLIMEWFKENGSQYRHVALTSVPLSSADISAKWLFNNFGTWFRSFNVIPSPRATDPFNYYDKSKTEFLYWLNKGDYFIDDNQQNMEGVSSKIKTYLFPQPWNSSSQNFNYGIFQNFLNND
jgi:5'(3')-deoxyribonucleotidase